MGESEGAELEELAALRRARDERKGAGNMRRRTLRDGPSSSQLQPLSPLARTLTVADGVADGKTSGGTGSPPQAEGRTSRRITLRQPLSVNAMSTPDSAATTNNGISLRTSAELHPLSADRTEGKALLSPTNLSRTSTITRSGAAGGLSESMQVAGSVGGAV